MGQTKTDTHITRTQTHTHTLSLSPSLSLSTTHTLKDRRTNTETPNSSSSLHAMALIVDFIGSAYSIVAMQDKVWRVLEDRSPGAGNHACTVTLRAVNTAGVVKESTFASKPRGGEWSDQDKKSNLASMKKLYRHQNVKEKEKRKAKRRGGNPQNHAGGTHVPPDDDPTAAPTGGSLSDSSSASIPQQRAAKLASVQKQVEDLLKVLQRVQSTSPRLEAEPAAASPSSSPSTLQRVGSKRKHTSAGMRETAAAKAAGIKWTQGLARNKRARTGNMLSDTNQSVATHQSTKPALKQLARASKVTVTTPNEVTVSGARRQQHVMSTCYRPGQSLSGDAFGNCLAKQACTDSTGQSQGTSSDSDGDEYSSVDADCTPVGPVNQNSDRNALPILVTVADSHSGADADSAVPSAALGVATKDAASGFTPMQSTVTTKLPISSLPSGSCNNFVKAPAPAVTRLPTVRDDSKAVIDIANLMRVALQGDTALMQLLGYSTHRAPPIMSSAQCIDHLERLVINGHVDAHAALASMLARGQGCSPDRPQRAITLYQQYLSRSPESFDCTRHAEIQYRIAMLLGSDSTAVTWLWKSAARRHKEAIFRLAEMDDASRNKLLILAAVLGHPGARETIARHDKLAKPMNWLLTEGGAMAKIDTWWKGSVLQIAGQLFGILQTWFTARRAGKSLFSPPVQEKGKKPFWTDQQLAQYQANVDELVAAKLSMGLHFAKGELITQNSKAAIEMARQISAIKKKWAAAELLFGKDARCQWQTEIDNEMSNFQQLRGFAEHVCEEDCSDDEERLKFPLSSVYQSGGFFPSIVPTGNIQQDRVALEADMLKDLEERQKRENAPRWEPESEDEEEQLIMKHVHQR